MIERALAILGYGLKAGRKQLAAVQNALLVERQLARMAHPRKLHLGCGTIRMEGWINVDADAQPSVDLAWDLRYGIPGAAGTAAFVFCEHLFEHLTPQDGVSLLRECRRVLKPGGTARIAMPSLDSILGLVCEGRWQEQDWVKECRNPIQTQAEMLNMVFRNWGHQWMYDRDELERRIKEAGFSTFRFVEPGQSEISELRNLETRPDSLLICEIDNV